MCEGLRLRLCLFVSAQRLRRQMRAAACPDAACGPFGRTRSLGRVAVSPTIGEGLHAVARHLQWLVSGSEARSAQGC